MGEVLSSGTLLVVEDDPDVMTSARILLARHGYRVLEATSPTRAWDVLAAEAVEVVLLDLNFTRGATSGQEGFDWLSQLRGQDPQAVVVVITGHSGVNVAVAAMKAGASDFVMKPWSNARLLDTVRDAVELARRRRGANPSPRLHAEALILGDSPQIRELRSRLERVAASRASVMLLGPAGVGKSLAAKILHARSGRSGALVTLDVRGFAAEDEVATIRAAVSEASGGTLVLDEPGELRPPAQAQLLASLDAAADVRLATTARVRPERLREDLLARLATVEVALPPLAERGDDVVLLAEHFVRQVARRDDLRPRPLDATALAVLRTKPPIGEVRALRQAIERAVVLGSGDTLTAADLAPPPPPGEAAASDLNLARGERAAVEAALRRHAHNISHAARELGLTRAALYRRMVKHGL